MQMTAVFDASLWKPGGGNKKFLHQPGAVRDFLRPFRFFDGIEVIVAALENGLRSIDLAHLAAEPGVKAMKIMTGGR